MSQPGHNLSSLNTCYRFPLIALCLMTSMGMLSAGTHDGSVEGQGVGPGFALIEQDSATPVTLQGESTQVHPGVGTSRIDADCHGKYGVDNLHELIASGVYARTCATTSGTYSWPAYYIDPDTGKEAGLEGFTVEVEWATTGNYSSTGDVMGQWRFVLQPAGTVIMDVQFYGGMVTVQRWNEPPERYYMDMNDGSISESVDAPVTNNPDAFVEVNYYGRSCLVTNHQQANLFVPGSNKLEWHYTWAHKGIDVVEPEDPSGTPTASILQHDPRAICHKIARPYQIRRILSMSLDPIIFSERAIFKKRRPLHVLLAAT